MRRTPNDTSFSVSRIVLMQLQGLQFYLTAKLSSLTVKCKTYIMQKLKSVLVFSFVFKNLLFTAKYSLINCIGSNLDWLFHNFIYRKETKQDIQKARIDCNKFLPLQIWGHWSCQFGFTMYIFHLILNTKSHMIFLFCPITPLETLIPVMFQFLH